MKKEDLKQSNVVFDAATHTYRLDGMLLQGITKMIQKHIFPDKYKGVPEHILQTRAEFGTKFHQDMQNYIEMGIESDSPAFGMFMEHFSGIKFIASEYIVTDGLNFASAIDAVDEDGIIYDFKTSTKEDIPYWKWQLGVYDYLFTMQNGFSPKGHRVIWINKDLSYSCEDIEPVNHACVEALFNAETSGKPIMLPATVLMEDKVAALAQIEGTIVEFETRLKEVKARKEELKAAILETFPKLGIKTWETDVLKITVKDAYKRTTVDSKKLKEDYPDVYNECTIESTVKESLIIKLK